MVLKKSPLPTLPTGRQAAGRPGGFRGKQQQSGTDLKTLQISVMLRIDNHIFSLDLLEKKFICDLPECLGNCCRYGDSGAPLTPDEVKILNDIQADLEPYLRHAGKKTIDESGTSERDIEGEMVTPLIDGAECAYTIIEDGNIFKCAIEKAWSDGRITFRKPISCNLFPVRMKKFVTFTAVNYEELPICMAARERGRKEDVCAYEFLREPLIRALGEEMYDQLCIAALELRKPPNPPKGGLNKL
jgi:hypothetical protein